MRFYSYSELTDLVLGLQNIGYVAPLLNYKKELADNGFKKHIHLYPVNISFTKDIIVIRLIDNNTDSNGILNCTNVYTIRAVRKCQKED